MKLFSYGKDGGPDSTVWGFWLIEIKSLFSVVLLRFEHGSRDAYHNHAFHAISWVLKGALREDVRTIEGHYDQFYQPSFWPIITSRRRTHKVMSFGTTWVLSFRGPWSSTWQEWIPVTNKTITLTHGRKEI